MTWHDLTRFGFAQPGWLWLLFLLLAPADAGAEHLKDSVNAKLDHTKDHEADRRE